MNDLRILRDRQRTQQQLADSARDRDTDCASAMLVQTTTMTTYPTTASTFYACNPVEINGDETEGTAASYVADTGTTLFALNVGTQVPPVGTNVVIHGVGGRYVFRYDG